MCVSEILYENGALEERALTKVKDIHNIVWHLDLAMPEITATF